MSKARLKKKPPPPQLPVLALVATLIALMCGTSLVYLGKDTAGVGIITWVIGWWMRPPGLPPGPGGLPPGAIVGILLLILGG